MINNRNSSFVCDMKWSKDGEKVCIIYDDGAVIVGSVNGKRLWGMELHVNLRLVEWSPGGQSILICTSKGQCLIFNSLGNPLSTIFLAASGGLPPVGIDWCKGNESHDENFQFPKLVRLPQNARDPNAAAAEPEHRVRLSQRACALDHARFGLPGERRELSGGGAGFLRVKRRRVFEFPRFWQKLV